MSTAHDRHLAAYHTYPADVWCPSVGCRNYAQPITVTVHVEYGQGWYEPEDCWACGSAWTDEPPTCVSCGYEFTAADAPVVTDEGATCPDCTDEREG